MIEPLPPAARLALAAIAGAVLPLAFSPFDWFWLAPLSMALFFGMLHMTADPKQAFWIGGAFGWASFLAGTHWVFVSIYQFGGTSIFLAGGLTLGMVFILGLYPAAVGWMSARFFSSAGHWRVALILPALWVLAEWVRGWFLSGFGWLSLGYSQTDSFLVGYAPLVGLLGTGLAVTLTAACLVLVITTKGFAKAAPVVTALMIWLAGLGLTNLPFTQSRGDATEVSLLQAAIPQEEKWLARQRRPTLELYEQLTRQEHGRDLIIWPEAAIPVLYDRVTGYLAEIQAQAREAGSSVLLGILKDHASGSFQNTLLALTPERQFYYKRNLVPFGEFFPVPGFVRNWMRLQSLPYTDAEPGGHDQTPLIVGRHKLGATICYEDAFGANQRFMNSQATLLVNVSNDAWFGDSIAPHQHLQIARLRAVEAGRYLLRATNTGITAVIDPRGSVIARGPQFETTVVRATVSGFEGTTPYTRFGDYPLLGICATAFLLAFIRLRATA